MRKLFILILSIIYTCQCYAQTAIIKDVEGYSNVREAAGTASAIIDTLANGRIVFVLEDEATSNWLSVDYTKGNAIRSGYIHRSRIIFLSNLSKFKHVIINENSFKLQYESEQISVSKRKFISKGKKITYKKPPGEQQLVHLIDTKLPWGTDGKIPHFEYHQVELKTSNQVLTFPTATLSNLFEPNLDKTTAYKDRSTGKIYLEAYNSDAAGSYVVTWTLKDGKILNRDIIIPF